MGLRETKMKNKDNWIEFNKNEIMHAIIISQNELQRAVLENNYDEEFRLSNALIHLKETLFELNLKEYQIKHSRHNKNTKGGH